MKHSIKIVLFFLFLLHPVALKAQFGDFFDAVRETAMQGLHPRQLGSKRLNKEQIVGTWAYVSPVLVFETNNIASKLGAVMAANELEEKMATGLSKAGITPSKLSVSFYNDGRYKAVIHDTELEGTYKLQGATLILDAQLGTGTVEANALRDGHELQLAVKPNRFLNLVQSMSTCTSSAGASLQSLSELLKAYNGIRIGVCLRRQ